MARLTKPKIDRRVKVAILPSSDAKEAVELDYRVLIPGNFSHSELGSHKDGDGSLKEREIREIKKKKDFQAVLSSLNPKLKLNVRNRLVDDKDAELEVNFDIKEMKDFHPDEIVKNVEPLQELLAARNRLKSLKLLVRKDPKMTKAIDTILNEGKSSIEDLMAKLAPEEGKTE